MASRQMGPCVFAFPIKSRLDDQITARVAHTKRKDIPSRGRCAASHDLRGGVYHVPMEARGLQSRNAGKRRCAKVKDLHAMCLADGNIACG